MWLFKEMKPHAERGDAVAQWTMGLLYEAGEGGVAQDYKTSFKWYQLSAKQGYSSAQTSLGDMYYHGKGVVQDYRAAFDWYQLAAEQKYPIAQIKLGDMYYQGKIDTDYSRAYMWWDIASSKRTGIAADKRNKIENKMTDPQVELAQKLVRECVSKKYKNC